MHKQEFLSQLQKRLSRLPQDEILERMTFYSEMIDDRMEDGLSEEEAVAAIGDLDTIVRDILAETPVAEPPKQEQKQKRKLSWWEIRLLVLGFPVWGSLLIAVVAVVFSVWISLWAVVISLYGAAVALGVSAIGCLIAGFFTAGSGAIIVTLGAALVCAGLAILVCMLSNLAAKGMTSLTKLTWNAIFHRKERTV